MQQLPLFKPESLVISKKTKRLFIVRKITGEVCECISFPRTIAEEVCDISFFLYKKDIEYLNQEG
jgi:hypothetical protein